MGELSPTHWLIVIVVAVVLFGARRLPDAARGLGRSVRILKAEMSGATEETGPAESAEPDPAPAALPAPERAEANRAATGGTPASDAPATAASGTEGADQQQTTHLLAAPDRRGNG
ncbi:MAG TPA: Sec-independent protein translocase subunit TatA [Pseudonocardia sp.]|uniref:Sec-independent protein translocase subunit TatA n=1 Tax=Pseudonocardia sp. TaxID=60912 RepID=UPI002EDBB5A6